MDKETNVSAAGYIITFFNDIESLTNSLGSYSNLLSTFKGKYPLKETLAKVEDSEKNQALQILYDTRFWVVRTYVKFSALKKPIKEFQSNSQAIDLLYKKLMESPAFEFEELNNYVIELNKLFVSGIVSTLLTKAYDIYAQFSGNTK